MEPKLMALPVKLTSDEVKIRGKELAKLVEKINFLDEQKKAVQKEFKGKIDALICERDDLARVVESGKETRQVEVYERKSYHEGVAEIFRSDTHELVTTRPLTETEILKGKQPELTLEKTESGSTKVTIPGDSMEEVASGLKEAAELLETEEPH